MEDAPDAPAHVQLGSHRPTGRNVGEGPDRTTAGQSADGTGMVINSSRAILYAGSGVDFAQRARAVAQSTRDEINRHRRRS